METTTNQPVVSIVMPTYNSEATLPNTLDSLLQQSTNFSYEIILVDDGSSDNTNQIEAKYANQYPNVKLFQQNHRFQAEARNLGIKNAQGKYLMFCDDDDLYQPTFVDQMVKSVRGQKLVIAGIEKKFADNHVVMETHSALENSTSNVELIGNYLTKNAELDVGLWNKIFRLDLIKKNSVIMSNDNFFEDSLFVLNYLQLINYQEIAYLHEPLYILNKHQGSTTNSYDPSLLTKCENYIQMVEKMLQRQPKLFAYFPGFQNRIYLFYLHRNILNNPQWDIRKETHLLQTSWQSLKYLPRNYQVAIIGIKLFPRLYSHLYQTKNGVNREKIH
ncbi:glycosyltransferase family 2 protein [Fructilactobacillus myrtifloralis]|uniref:Glycosyltransferase family 2 protein n=1 Tax=Fructilactobacillus myrtifloralis TaxID=2940301 RepID=A0ABY5BM78_9LACO|nr:glycosyltransferase family 2 protein [Fructilactobacillus myrtifloralis]USS84722.1 glycosyltransferase family 2 protein [Fructilactobacillus myrtifloralis]